MISTDRVAVHGPRWAMKEHLPLTARCALAMHPVELVRAARVAMADHLARHAALARSIEEVRHHAAWAAAYEPEHPGALAMLRDNPGPNTYQHLPIFVAETEPFPAGNTVSFLRLELKTTHSKDTQMALKFLDDVAAEAATTRAAAWSAYRELLQKSLSDGELPADDQARLVELVKRLDLKPAQIETHAQALLKIGQRQKDQAELAGLEAQRKSMVPAMDAFIAKKTKLLGELDQEGAGLWQPAAMLDQRIQSLRNRMPSEFDLRSTPELHEFFAFVAPPPPPRANTKQIEESSKRAEVWRVWIAVREELQAGKPRGKQWDDHTHDCVTAAFQYAKEPNPDPMVYGAGTWPHDDDPRFAPGVAIDPRRPELSK